MKILLLLLTVLMSQILYSTESGSKKVHILYFYESDCPNCTKMNNSVMPLILEKYSSKIIFLKRNVEEIENFEAMMAFESFYNIPPGTVPEFYTSYGVVWKRNEILTKLPELIEKELKAEGSGDFQKFFDNYLKTGKTGMEMADVVKSLYKRGISANSGEVKNSLNNLGRGGKLEVYEFRKAGCRSCNRLSLDLRYFVQKYPDQILLKTFNIKDKKGKVLNEAFCIKYGLPEKVHLTTPALFFGNYALAGKDEFQKREILPLLIDAVVSLEDSRTKVPSDRELILAQEAIYRRFATISLSAVFTAGILDGINPCAFVTILFLLSYLALMKYSRKDIALVGISFTTAVFITYLFIGVGFLKFVTALQKIPYLENIIYYSAIIFTGVIGIMNIRDWYLIKNGSLKDMNLKLSNRLRHRINAVIRKNVKLRHYVIGAFGMGCAVSFLELACTGQVYLPTVLFIINTQGIHFRAVALLIAYNLAFILPLVVVFILFWKGNSEKHISKWLTENGAEIKLAMGLLFLLLSILLFIF
jgi:cytochrome c biogenesis protein CcdA